MSLPLVLMIGHSHLRAPHAAWEADAALRKRLEVAFAPLTGGAFRPPIDEGGRLHRSLAALLTARRLVAVVCALQGNRHNEIALARRPEPVDTVPPGTDTLACEGPVLPFGLMVASLRRRNADVAALLGALAAASAVPVFQLDSPPPIPSEAHLRASPGGFGAIFARDGIVPAATRHRVWQAHSAAMAAICAEAGAHLLPVPATMQDARGMLIPEAWAADPTHGNATYGAAVLAEVARLAETLPMRADLVAPGRAS